MESPPGHKMRCDAAPHEYFYYVIQGVLDAEVDGEKKRSGPGDVIHAPKGKPYRWTVAKDGNARYAGVRSTPALEAQIDKNGAADNW